jgi:hypothetical protein
MNPILKYFPLIIFALFSHFSSPLSAAKTITEIPVLIDNPTSYDVELWLSDGDSHQNGKECFVVHSGESINYSIPLQKPVTSHTVDTTRELSYRTQLSDLVDDDDSEISVGDQESSFSVDARDRLVHLVLQLERVYPESEHCQLEPFDVISISNK